MAREYSEELDYLYINRETSNNNLCKYQLYSLSIFSFQQYNKLDL